MSKRTKIICGLSVWTVFASIIIYTFTSSCSEGKAISIKPSDEGLLLNDDLVAIKENDGNITIKNTQTGEVTAEKIKFDWTSASPNYSFCVFCSY